MEPAKIASIALGPALKANHWIVTSGPSRCSNQPWPTRVVWLPITPWAWVMLGK